LLLALVKSGKKCRKRLEELKNDQEISKGLGSVET
jgi:hypothetical protein